MPSIDRLPHRDSRLTIECSQRLAAAPRYFVWRPYLLATLLLTMLPVAALAEEEDEDFPPGLLATYSVGDHSVERIDRTIAFDWGTAAPDERLPQGAFRATWTGNILVRSSGRYRFHASAIGRVAIAIDGEEVLRTDSATGFVSGESHEISGGDRQIRIEYAAPDEAEPGPVRLAVFWSSDKFTLEPLPSDILFRDDTSRVWQQGQGREWMDALRCAACHTTETTTDGLASLKAPALDRIQGSQSVDTLIQRLTDPKSVVANSHMPNFGLNHDEAESVAAFLWSVSKAPAEHHAVAFKKDDAGIGTKLLNSLGCIACHELPVQSKRVETLAGPYAGPELSSAGQRRTAAWLLRWLKNPASLNPGHRMPVFDVSDDECRQLVAALVADSGSKTNATIKTDAHSIQNGKQIIEAANCAACHDIPGVQSRPLPVLTANDVDSGTHCLRSDNGTPSGNTAKRVPQFQVEDATRDAMLSWMQTCQHHSSPDPTTQGQRLLKRNGCVACHDRSPGLGISAFAGRLQKTHPDLKGMSQGLVPPPLTAIGDKLNDDYLKKAVSGEQGEKRLPWLLVRMPKFRHSKAQHQAIVQHLIHSDRIPDEADSVRQDVLAQIDVSGNAVASAADLQLGNTLTGAGGFNCVACHKAGSFEPRKVALGTRGSDIMTMGRRIRPRFFQRWMANPIRVVAGIEMPAIKKAMPDILDGSLSQQIGTIWRALSDERFTPPTVTSRFEQVVNVRPGEQPRLIRDVFTIGTDKDREAVARSMAIGFGNGHNVLIDLDTMNVRLWTFGEFARQRTEGKGWYWDMPGAVIQHTPDRPFPHTLNTGQGRREAVVDEDRAAELLSYRLLPDGVEFTTRSWFDMTGGSTAAADAGQPHFAPTAWADPSRPLQAVTTKHIFQSVDADGDATGWKRTMEVVDVPQGCSLSSADGELLNPEGATTEIQRHLVGAGGAVAQDDSVSLTVTTAVGPRVPGRATAVKEIIATAEDVTSTPGFTGRRLPLPGSVMPTAMAWLSDGRMVFTSLKGHVWVAADSDNDGVPDEAQLFEEGLAAPFGVLTEGDSVIVSHKPEILRLRDATGDGRADTREVIASGWGYNDNYHDWTAGLVRDADGNMFAGLGSDYSQKSRPASQDRWRGGIIKIQPNGTVTPVAMSMRYPLGLAINKHGHLFATDNQGVQNTFNEINHIIPGRHYGVPSRHQPAENLSTETPAVMVPHPWTRSMNSIVFLPENFAVPQLRGHGIGCEYDSRFLMRFTIQDVNGTMQGASYRFSRPNLEAGGSNFIGPISSAVSPEGHLYIGSIWDSGWQGGRNTGGITRLVPSPDDLPNGIQEVRATADGFEVRFFRPLDKAAVENPDSWSIQGYTREWGGGYATPESGRHTVRIQSIESADDGRLAHIVVDALKPEFVYDISTGGPLAASAELWPEEAHYSMKVVPAKTPAQ